MPTVNPTLPSDDTTADVADYNIPIQAILAVFNGHIDGDNIEPGSLPWSVMDGFSGEIAAEAMDDNANIELYRNEANIGFVASGLVVSAISGLNGAVTAGVIYTPDGKRKAVSAVASRAFTASKDTYVDVAPSGSISYTEVANGATAPDPGTDNLRLAIVVTDGSAITGVHETARRNGEVWKEIGRMKIGIASDTIVLDKLPVRKYLKVDISLLATGGEVGPSLRFNGDSSTNYSRRSSLNVGADSTQTSATGIGAGASSNSMVYATVEIINIATYQKFIKGIQVAGSSSASAAPDRLLWSGKWSNTTNAITRIDVNNSGAGDFAIGSEVVVYGRD